MVNIIMGFPFKSRLFMENAVMYEASMVLVISIKHWAHLSFTLINVYIALQTHVYVW